ncbi:MAG: ATP-dependent helicase [Dissulfuribacterales bacterium]
MNICDGLNDAQRGAVFAACPHLLVEAGPGTGKTRVLVCRIVHLIADRGVPHHSILAVTFTRRAAHELAQRVQIACDLSVYARTFHAWAYDFLKSWQHACDDGSVFRPLSLLSEEEAVAICNELAVALDLDKKRNWYELISQARQHWPFSFSDVNVQTLYEAYERRLNEQGYCDYDHLLFKALQCLQSLEGMRFFADRISHVLVDEFQDVNAVQYELVRQMALAGAQLTVIGDSNQAIYGFRGASPHFMTRFLKDFEGAQSIGLEEVYRCPQTFLDAAQAVLPSGSGRVLVSKVEKDSPIQLRSFEDAFQEAEWIAQEIEGLAGGFYMERTGHGMAVRSLADVAVLYRTHRVGELIRHRLHEKGIPYTYCSSAADEPDLQRLLQLLDRNECERFLDLQVYLHQLLQILGIERPSSGLSAFLQLAEGLSGWDGLQELAAGLSYSNTAMCELYGVNLESVSLLSMHAAKGLEFPVVFLVGMEDGGFPLLGSDEAEEARLCYVAMTRARERLYVSWCNRRKSHHVLNGQGRQSRFIDKMLPYARLEEKKYAGKGRRPRQNRLF